MPPKGLRIDVKRSRARLEGEQASAGSSILNPKGLHETEGRLSLQHRGVQDDVARKFLNSKGLQPIMDSFGPHPILNSKVKGGSARVNQLFANHNESAKDTGSGQLNKKRQIILDFTNTETSDEIDQQVGNHKMAYDHGSPTNDIFKETTLNHSSQTTGINPHLNECDVSKGGAYHEFKKKRMGNDNSSSTNDGSKKTTPEHSEHTTDNTSHVDKRNMSKGNKKRGKTHMLHIWGRPSILPPISLEVNENGAPIGKDAVTFAEWLGTVARNGQYCPLDVVTWHKMPEQKKKDVLDLIKARFDITLVDESLVLSSVASKWRSYKSYLKTKYWSPNHMEYNLEGDDILQVSREQWFKLLEHWNKEDTMELCRKNKIARSKRCMNQATGKQSFANVSKKLEVKAGHKPSRADLFWACYSRKTNTPKDVSQAWTKMQELRNQLPEGEEDIIAPNDIYAQVLGEDKPGRIRMLGSGVSPSDVWGDVPNRKPTKRAMLAHKEILVKTQKENAHLRAQLQMHQTNPNNQNNAHLTRQNLEVGAFVSLKSLMDPTREVAKGYIHSVDATKEVGGQVLGPALCEVLVIVVLHGEEHLVRPFEFYSKLEETIGVPIAWPIMLVTPAERI